MQKKMRKTILEIIVDYQNPLEQAAPEIDDSYN